jgi:hypothetical protein
MGQKVIQSSHDWAAGIAELLAVEELELAIHVVGESSRDKWSVGPWLPPNAARSISVAVAAETIEAPIATPEVLSRATQTGGIVSESRPE